MLIRVALVNNSRDAHGRLHAQRAALRHLLWPTLSPLFRKTDPLSIWKSMNKRKFVPLFIMASWYGSMLAVAVFVTGDNNDKCMGTDLCYCVKNGLIEGGVKEAYCFLIYPNANWTTTPPILGPHLNP